MAARKPAAGQVRPGIASTLAVLAMLAGGTAIVRPAWAHDQSSAEDAVAVPDSGRITVTANEFAFEPSAIRARAGQHVTVVFRNEGALSHNLTIPSLDVHTATVQTGSSDRITFTAPESGTYRFWCTVPGHKEAGMVGHVDVAQ